MYDAILTDFPRLCNETDDSPRIQRAIDAAPNGILCIPKGDYRIARPLFIRNRCSLDMHPAARLIAVEKMNFVLTYDGNGNFHELTLYDEAGEVYDNLGLFIRGGDIDGAGLASCLLLENAHHYTLSNISLHNGKTYGLCVGGVMDGRLYELVANNVYCKCTMPGLAGNIGICARQCDLHFTDCFVIDYTIGVRDTGGANRYTRCHIWGGTVPPVGLTVKEWSVAYAERKKKMREGGYDDAMEAEILACGVPEMLVDSISFELNGSGNVVDGCYADTASIGYLVRGGSNVITNSGSFNNKLMGLRNTVAIKNESSKLIVNNCRFTNATGSDRVYEGKREALVWHSNFTNDDSMGDDYFLLRKNEE
ncbi:MAG: hypothetical protein E7463_15100 [Ruminococcaceae bacterium]|nr:hypothetical protein [Oscillospiraceae bacterium]